MWEDRKMKARVKATGEIVEFTELMLLEEDRTTYRKTEDLEFLDLPINELDYWEKLKHQYAGMAMHSLIIKDCSIKEIVETSSEIATALVNKLKEAEK